MLIRVEINAGHGVGAPISKTIELYTALFGFTTLYNMGYRVLPNKMSHNLKCEIL